ncbi:hypothetical protein PPYR_03521 [Photinus pyralis]|uniref:Peptidase M13 N-terminal domain-containing protein n=1 Tax=Photinus pyralis TaxID=7054 RepID=A0A5N4A342_PHOPY|nr:neprilysin-1-like [Photinus pyralis]KAB0791721.1 hypothetical protein PPYR_03521 [Photinus pyralis]
MVLGLIVPLLSISLLPPALSDVCTTVACRKASSDVLSFIDPSIDPCRDFYKFTCGSLFKKTFDTKLVSLEALVGKEVEDQTKKMLQKSVDPNEPKAFQALKKFFRACMDEVTIERDATQTLKDVLGNLGGLPLLESKWDERKFNLENLMIKLREYGYEYMQLFYFGTTVGEDDKTLLIGEPIIKNVEPDYVDSYYEFLRKVSELVGVKTSTAEPELKDLLNFKLELLQIVEKSGPFQKTTIRNIQKEFPLLNWSRLINKIIHPNKEQSDDQEMYFPSVEYLKELGVLLKNTANRTLANYIMWQTIESAIPYLPHEFSHLKEKYPRAFYDTNHDASTKTRLSYCKNEAKRIFPPVFELMYITEYFPRERRQSIKDLVSIIHMELMNLLNETELYDESTRKIMLEKAKAITYHFGAPERLFEDGLASRLFTKDENVETNNFLTLASILLRQRANFRYNLQNGVNRYDNYYEETTLVHSFYEPYRNAFVIPAASLQGLYFNENRPQYLNFGTIGTIAGIELIRGFTESGSKFDKDGNRAETWTKNTDQVFSKKTDCLVREASFFEIEDSILRMDGRLILEKTTCDYTGVEIAYRAYNTWVKIYGKEAQLPGLNYNPRQLFWISSASTFCDTISLDNLKQFIVEDHQVHPTFRVFGSMTNNEHFGKDFNCTIESPMNPAIKCKVF